MSRESSKAELIQKQIDFKSSLIDDKRKAGQARADSLKEQLKMKKERARTLRRRVALKPGGVEIRKDQREEFRLYNKLVRDVEREIRALEKETNLAKKDTDLEINILRQEINQLKAEKRLYANVERIIKTSNYLDQAEMHMESDVLMGKVFNLLSE